MTNVMIAEAAALSMKGLPDYDSDALPATGYPFLHAARQLGLEYGTMLAYADAVRKDMQPGASTYDPWEGRAVKHVMALGHAARNRVDRVTHALVRRMLEEKGVKLDRAYGG